MPADAPKPHLQRTALVTSLGAAAIAAIAGFASVYVTLGVLTTPFVHRRRRLFRR